MQTKTAPLFSKLLAIILIPLFLSLSLTDAISAVVVQQQDTCEELLAEAETKYFEGLLDETIELVNVCLNQDEITLEQREKGYKLLGKAYHAKGLLEQAKDNIRKLLELIPNWQPNPNVDTPSFQRLAEEVIAEIERQEEQAEREQAEQPAEQTEPPPSESEKGGSKALLFIAGGGAIAAGALVFALTGGGGGGANNQLPDPPPLPGN